MAIKIKFPKRKPGRSRLADPIVQAAVAAFLILCTAAFGVFAFYYVKYQKIIDQRMSGPVFANTAKIYAAPYPIHPGDHLKREEIAAMLRRAGYSEESEKGESRLGVYHLVPNGIEIKPGPESYHSPEGALVRVDSGVIQQISTLGQGGTLSGYELEPELVTGLFDAQQRAKRRLVTYDELPSSLINAVLAIEDRRFFQHNGVNYLRLAQAVFRDFESGRKSEGGSTLTMQIARGFFLSPEKKISRKLAEILISIELEQRFSKKQIFEFYANQIDMGQRGSFTIKGLGEAAQAYFGKDVSALNLPESALLAGIIQRPSYLSPYRHPERALERRNVVLNAMVETGAISPQEAEKAKATPLNLAPPNVEASDAPYFVDLVKDTLIDEDGFTEDQLNQDGLRIYTSLDPDLQKAAAEAVSAGLKEVDALVQKRRTRRVKVGKGKSAHWETKVMPGPDAQVALIAMDPDTGDVLALVGGRNYAWSQLNHAIAKRPTGSIFKPFVYAAAVNTALTGQQPIYTASTLIDDSPGTFEYEDGKVYEPHNFQDEYFGLVTARFALAHSLNNATIKLAEEVGYDKIAALAREAGIKSVQPTPAMAIGAYDATPLEMAGAYTAFANNGVRSTPMLIRSVRDAKGDVMQDFKPIQKPIMDPRVAYVLTNMMEAVINNGTAAGVRARGFTAPAAGKTGTSHDAWFAGYTSNLLCVVWVGYDDYSDLRLEGAHTAAPIWEEFMQRAIKLPAYRNVQPFTPPAGVVNLTLDKVTNRIATATCPDDYTAAFIQGTEPTDTCDSGSGPHGILSIFGLAPKPSPPAAVSNGQVGVVAQSPGKQSPAPTQENTKKKKGFWGKFLGVFTGDDSKDKEKEPQNPSPPKRQEKQ